MILKTTRITTSGGAGAVLNHVLHGQDNEQIMIISGSQFEAENAMEDAQHAGVTYGLRHISIASKETMTDDQRARAVEVYCNEHNIKKSEIMLRVRHLKSRHDGSGDPEHEHLLVREFDPTRRRVLNCSNYKRINEKISRILEVEFGHAIVKGKHNKAAIRALETEGKNYVIEKLLAAKIDTGKPAISSYSADTHQKTKRNGISMPQLKAAVVAAFKSDNPLMNLPSNILISRGTKKWIAEAVKGDGSKILIGSVDRIIKSEDAIVAKLITQRTKEIINVRSKTVHPARREAPLFLRDVPTVREFSHFSAKQLSLQNVLLDNASNRQERGIQRSDNKLLGLSAERVARNVEPARPVAQAQPSVPAKAAAAPRPQAPVAATRQPKARAAGNQAHGRHQPQAGQQNAHSGHGGAGGGTISGGGKIVRPYSGDPSDLARFLEESAAAIALKPRHPAPAPPAGLASEIIQAWAAFFAVSQAMCDHATTKPRYRDEAPSFALNVIKEAYQELEIAKQALKMAVVKRGFFDIGHASRAAAAHDYIEKKQSDYNDAKRFYGHLANSEREHVNAVSQHNNELSIEHNIKSIALQYLKNAVLTRDIKLTKIIVNNIEAAITIAKSKYCVADHVLDTFYNHSASVSDPNGVK